MLRESIRRPGSFGQEPFDDVGRDERPEHVGRGAGCPFGAKLSVALEQPDESSAVRALCSDDVCVVCGGVSIDMPNPFDCACDREESRVVAREMSCPGIEG